MGDELSVCAIVLAAGRGRRMGGAKHLLALNGRPMLAHVIAALRGSGVEAIVGVLRPGDAAGEALLAESDAVVAWAEPADEGRAASVRAGVRAAKPGCDLLFALADQPFLRAEDFEKLIEARSETGTGIVHARYAGERGSPVLFASGYRDELLQLEGAQGGRSIIATHPEDAHGVELDPLRGRDVDEPGDLP